MTLIIRFTHAAIQRINLISRIGTQVNHTMVLSKITG